MKLEKKMIKFSAFGGLFFAVMGLAWGLMAKSSMILFDGMYSLISLFLSILALWVTNYIEKADFKKFPFGKVMLEPLAVAFKSIVLIVMCIITLYDAAGEIAAGGHAVDTGMALAYSVVSSVVCIFVYMYMHEKGKKLCSDILKAESSQWFMDSILSVAVLVGFIVSAILSMTSWASLNRYVDPAMVIISSLIFIKIPTATLFKSFREIVSGSADDKINDEIYTIVKDIEEEYNFEDSITRVSKIGRELRIEIDFVFNDESSLNELEQMDEVREQVYRNMTDIKLKKWLNVNFTGDRKWAI